jgi:hypothetical protein
MFDIIDNDSFDILVVWADGCPDGWLPVAVSQRWVTTPKTQK